MKIGILREEKVPHDRRVPFTPEQCAQLLKEYKNLQLVVQPSNWRSYSDSEYDANGITLQENLADCDIIMGVKEVPKELLIEGKIYFFFSHTIKKQMHNQLLLKALVDSKIQMVDYECLVDQHGNRVIGFGRYAGIVGAYNGLMGYGKKYGLFDLKPAELCKDKKELYSRLDEVNLPNIKIVVTGGGRVANGACETMGAMNVRKVTPYEFLNYTFREAVYVQLHSEHYYQAKDSNAFSSYDFHHEPGGYRCIFSDSNSFAAHTDLLIHCTYWDPRADILFSKDRMKDPDFRISVIADVTCDINGSIPSTTKATTIDNKFYGYNPLAASETTDPFDKQAITVMSIDNLPCELPRDASDGFGKHLIERVMPSLINGDQDHLIERASITKNGQLCQRFAYLTDYLNGVMS
jgi:saccharopine dehydrogenase (NAD+, L-lysine forming)